jgi:hypothetical protein
MNIAIRPYAASDAPFLYEAARESVAEVYPWLPWCHAGYTLGDAQSWIQSQIEAFANRTAFAFLIEEDKSRFLAVAA